LAIVRDKNALKARQQENARTAPRAVASCRSSVCSELTFVQLTTWAQKSHHRARRKRMKHWLTVSPFLDLPPPPCEAILQHRPMRTVECSARSPESLAATHARVPPQSSSAWSTNRRCRGIIMLIIKMLAPAACTNDGLQLP
jgi:hypothetical protein